MFGMKPRNTPNNPRDTEHFDYVTLADGTVCAVARANLAAAKDLLAAQKAAARRVAAAASQPRETVAAPTAAPASVPAQTHTGLRSRDGALYRITPRQARANPTTPSAVRAASAADVAPVLAMDGNDDIQRITLPVAMPCGLGDCGRPTHTALIEPDPTTAGLWNLLPICEESARHRSAGEPTQQAPSPMLFQ